MAPRQYSFGLILMKIAALIEIQLEGLWVGISGKTADDKRLCWMARLVKAADFLFQAVAVFTDRASHAGLQERRPAPDRPPDSGTRIRNVIAESVRHVVQAKT